MQAATAAARGPSLVRPTSVAEAAGLLDDLGAAGQALAGGTWAMRAPQRREPFASTYVSLAAIDELRRVDEGDPVSLGALATHDRLARLAPGLLGALRDAARLSGVPAVRAVATLGGNLCARGFAHAELTAALLALEASVEVATAPGSRLLPLDAYLEERPPGLLVRAVVPRTDAVSAYARLTVRATGEYPVCGVAVSAVLDGGVIGEARVAVVAVDERARLLPAAAEALRGVAVGDEAACLAAGRHGAQGLPGRDGLDAPGWYRLAVLPALLRDAARSLGGGA